MKVSLRIDKKNSFFLIVLIAILSFICSPVNTAFANTESDYIIVPDKTIYLTNEEHEKLIQSFEDSDNMTPFGVIPPSKTSLDWGSLIGRSTYTGGGSIKQYTNTGNAAKARKEFDNIGVGEVTSHVSNDGKVTHVKHTPNGDVRLYESSSETEGSQRPTLSFLKDKIRFIGY